MKLTVQKRENLGKNKVKQLRNEGKIPGVIYGSDKEPVTISTNPRALLDLFKTEMGENIVFDVAIEGEKDTEKVITYDISRDAITRQILHIDFMRVDNDKQLKLDVPIQLTGKAPGLKVGGVLIQKLTSLRILATPAQVPAKIVVDLSKLNLNDFVKVSNLSNDQGYQYVTNADDTIVRIAAPRKMDASALMMDDEAEEDAAVEGDSEAPAEEANAEG